MMCYRLRIVDETIKKFKQLKDASLTIKASADQARVTFVAGLGKPILEKLTTYKTSKLHKLFLHHHQQQFISLSLSMILMHS